MLRNSWKQLLNGKKKNIWIVLELLLVFCLIWYVVDYFFVLGYNKSLHSYRDLNNTYVIDLGTLSDNHAEYRAEESELTTAIENFRRIVNRLKEHSQIESIALASGEHSLPAFSYMNATEYRNAEDTTKIVGVQYAHFIPEEDYFEVFRHTTNKGKAPVFMNDFDWSDPSSILITRMVGNVLFPNESAIGKTVESTYTGSGQPRYQYRVVGVLDDVKRFSYLRPSAMIFFPQPLNEMNYSSAIISIRTKDNISPAQFIAEFKRDMSRNLQIGNYYLKNIRSYPQIEQDSEYRYGVTNNIRLQSILLLFFLINIALCVLGTFWHRVNTRREEVGVRRAMGSDAIGIQKLFIQEGLLLLLVILLPAMLIESQFILSGLMNTLGQDSRSYGDFLPDHTLLRFLITNTITLIILSMIVIVGIWYPALSASKVKPVDALRDE